MLRKIFSLITVLAAVTAMFAVSAPAGAAETILYSENFDGSGLTVDGFTGWTPSPSQVNTGTNGSYTGVLTSTLEDDGKGGKAWQLYKPSGENAPFYTTPVFSKTVSPAPDSVSPDYLQEFSFRFKFKNTPGANLERLIQLNQSGVSDSEGFINVWFSSGYQEIIFRSKNASGTIGNDARTRPTTGSPGNTGSVKADTYVSIRIVIDYTTQTYDGYVDYTDKDSNAQSKSFLGLAMPKKTAYTVSTVTGFDIKLYDNARMTGAEHIFTFDDFLLKNVSRPTQVTFDSRGGSTVGAVTVDNETNSIALPAAPTRSGYNFMGWYYDQDCSEAFNGANVTESLTVYAKWVQIPEDYVYYQNFEYDDAVYLQPPYNLAGNSVWTKAVEEIGGSMAVKYSSDAVSPSSTPTIQTATFTQINQNDGQLYEFGYKFSNSGFAACADFMKLIGKINGTENPVISSDIVSNTTGGYRFRIGNNAVISDLTTVIGLIDVKFTIGLGSTETENAANGWYTARVSYQTAAGPVSYKLLNQPLDYPVQELRYLKTKITTSASVAVEVIFDDIYVKKTGAEPLYVDSVNPLSGAVGVDKTEPAIRVTFEKVADAATLNDVSVLLKDGTADIAKTFVLEQDGKTLVIEPGADLDGGTEYTVVLKAGITAIDGGVLLNDYVFSFITDAPYNDNGIFDGKDTLNVVYLGGSITAGTGSTNGSNWASKTTDWLKEQYPGKTVNGINKGVGGTGSVVGYLRLQSDVINQNPDIVFVEFAVNDKGNAFNHSQKWMESITRRLQSLENPPIIIFVYTTTAVFGAVDTAITAHQSVADYYGIPSVNLRDYMKSLVEAGKLSTSDFIGDGTHPNDTGYNYYAQYIINKLRYDTGNYLKYSGKQDVKLNADAIEYGTVYKEVGENSVFTGNGWTFGNGYVISETPGDYLEFEFDGPLIAIYNQIGNSFGKVEIKLDGVVQETLDTYYNTPTLPNGQGVYSYINDSLTNTRHVLRLTVLDDKNSAGAGYKIRINKFVTAENPDIIKSIDVTSATVVDGDGNPVTSLADYAGKRVYVKLKVKNYYAPDSDFVSYVSVGGENGIKAAIVGSTGVLAQGGAPSDAINCDFVVDVNVTTEDKVSCFVWSPDLVPLTGKVTLPR
jgi:uncharacterized repeat protein (TIGR02543 family)